MKGKEGREEGEKVGMGEGRERKGERGEGGSEGKWREREGEKEGREEN